MLSGWLVSLAPGESAGQLNLTGRWTQLQNWELHGVHLSLLRGNTSHSALIGFNDDPNWTQPLFRAYRWNWNPNDTVATSGLVNITPDPSTGLFCSGHSTLGDGRLFVAGGSGPVTYGNAHTNIYDVAAGWLTPRPPDMEVTRWYPSCTTLPDGSVLTTSGYTYEHFVSFGGTDGIERRNDLNAILGMDEKLQDEGAQTFAGAPPAPRQDHTVVFDAGNFRDAFTYPEQGTMFPPDYELWNRVVMFGGMTDSGPSGETWAFLRDEGSGTWAAHELDPAPDPVHGVPLARSDHSAVFHPDQTIMIVYGGLASDGQALGDVWRLNLAGGSTHSGVWARLATTVTGAMSPPSPRYGHAAVLQRFPYPSRLIVIGGRLLGPAGALADTVWELSLPQTGTPTWRPLTVGGAGSQREQHSAVFVPGSPDRAVVFGGKTTGFDGSVWSLSLGTTPSWAEVATQPDAVAGSPSARWRHAAVYEASNYHRMVVMGGADAGAVFADVWTMPLGPGATPQWKRNHASLPSGGRAGHAAAYDSRENGTVARLPERYVGAPGWQGLDSAQGYLPFYPFVFVLPSGNLFYAGADTATRVLMNPLNTNPTWGPELESRIDGGSAVMYAPGKIMKCGGMSGEREDPGNFETETIDLSVSESSAWMISDSMDVDRTEHNLTILPTGQVLVTGGIWGPLSNREPQQTPEIWNPTTRRWNAPPDLAVEPKLRDYHSAALLLPDARVLSASGETEESGAAKSYAIYEPPYLFDAAGNRKARPVMTAAHDTIGYGQQLLINTPGPGDIAQVCLIRPGSVTHGHNQNQLRIPLSFDESTCFLVATSPASVNLAPPGDYLLFLVTHDQVPSVARWVRLRPGPPGPAPPDPGCGGCPMLDAWTENGWAKENSILGRTLDGTLAADVYRLQSKPEAGRDWHYRLRIRENEQEVTTLDEVRLLAVDHAAGTRAYVREGQAVLARRRPAYRVMKGGAEVTALLSGTEGALFRGAPGDTLVVELERPLPRGVPGEQVNDGGGFVIDPGGKGGEGEGGLQAVGVDALAPNVDERVLATNGILVQTRDAGGEWRTVTMQPRELPSEHVVDGVGGGPVRLVFVGKHRLGFVGRLEEVEVAPVRELALAAAAHTRLGDVLPALGSAGGATTSLAPGDTIALEFAAAPLAEGMAREWFVQARGSYTSVRAFARQPQGQETVRRRLALEVAGPNPFAGATGLAYALPERVRVELDVFDVRGRRLRRLLVGVREAGEGRVEWNGRDERGRRVEPGVYLCRLRAAGAHVERKLVVMP
jgi:hypothetical protein